MLLPSSHSSPKLVCKMPSPQPGADMPIQLAAVALPLLMPPSIKPLLSALAPLPPFALVPAPPVAELAPAPTRPLEPPALQLRIATHPAANAHKRLIFPRCIGRALQIRNGSIPPMLADAATDHRQRTEGPKCQGIFRPS